MALSKPTDAMYNLISIYFENLYNKPLKTKALTSCVVAILGNFLWQSKRPYISEDSLMAFGLFGLIFEGPMQHYFYKYVTKITKNPFGILLIERFLFTPCFLAVALYVLARLEGKRHQTSVSHVSRLHKRILIANLKYLTLIQYINMTYVPRMLRIFVQNLICLTWCMYLSKQRSKLEKDP